MKTQVKGVKPAARLPMEYALPQRVELRAALQGEGRDREKIKEMLMPLVKEAVQKQLQKQQEFYKSRPSMAVKQIEQVFGAGSLGKTLAPAVSRQVYEQMEDRLRHEWVRKGR